MFNKLLSKTIGTNYDIVCDRNKYTVSILFKGKEKNIFHFSKMYEAINFYAHFKKVKDVRDWLT